MPSPLSADLRRRIIGAYESGDMNQHEIAERFAVGTATVTRLMRLKRETGGIAPRPSTGGRAKRTIKAAGEALVRLWLEENPSLTIKELTERYNEDERTGQTSTSSMSRTLIRMGFSRKKNRRAR